MDLIIVLDDSPFKRRVMESYTEFSSLVGIISIGEIVTISYRTPSKRLLYYLEHSFTFVNVIGPSTLL